MASKGKNKLTRFPVVKEDITLYMDVQLDDESPSDEANKTSPDSTLTQKIKKNFVRSAPFGILLNLYLASSIFSCNLCPSVVKHNASFAAMVKLLGRRKSIRRDPEGRLIINVVSDLDGLNDSVVGAALQVYDDIPANEIIKAYLNSHTVIVGAQSVTARLMELFRFVIVGSYFNIDAIVDAALESILEELNWDNLEYAMAFALTGTFLPTEDFFQDADWTRFSMKHTFAGIRTSTFAAATELILEACLVFMIGKFPDRLFFAHVAPVSPILGVLRLESDGIPSNAHPSLPRIDPTSPHAYTTEYRDTVYLHRRISTIMLSAPFFLIARLHECLTELGRGSAFPTALILEARNARTLKYLQDAALAKGVRNCFVLTFDTLPMELFEGDAFPDRALWQEVELRYRGGLTRVVHHYLPGKASVRK